MFLSTVTRTAFFEINANIIETVYLLGPLELARTVRSPTPKLAEQPLVLARRFVHLNISTVAKDRKCISQALTFARNHGIFTLLYHVNITRTMLPSPLLWISNCQLCLDGADSRIHMLTCGLLRYPAGSTKLRFTTVSCRCLHVTLASSHVVTRSCER